MNDDNLNVTPEKEEELLRNKAIMKGKVTFTVIVIILIIIGLITFFIIKSNKKDTSIKIIDDKVVSYEINNGNIVFLNQDNNKVANYPCKSVSCNILENSFNDLLSINSIIINEEGLHKNVIYNYKTNKISSLYNKIKPINLNDEIYFMYQTNGNYGILDKNYDIKINAVYQYLEKIYNKDYFISKINDKYGILNINQEVIIENIYDELNVIDDYLLVKLNDKPFLINYLKEEIIEDADTINIVNDSLFIQKGNEIKLIKNNQEIFNYNLKDEYNTEIMKINYVIYEEDYNTLNILINNSFILSYDYNNKTINYISINDINQSINENENI